MHPAGADDNRPSRSDLDAVVKKYHLHISYERLAFRMAQLFSCVPIAERRLLEIGAGAGGFSMFAAAYGARSVVALEPEASGATTGASAAFAKAVDELQLRNIALETIEFQDFEAPPASFDVLLSFNSINHLDEDSCRSLLHVPESRDTYVKMFRRMYALLSNGGDLIVADCMRWNFFRLFPFVKHPFMPTIGWRNHHQPRIWISMMAEAGFKCFRVNYRVPYVLRTLPWLCDNFVASLMTLSHFTIHARKINGLQLPCNDGQPQ